MWTQEIKKLDENMFASDLEGWNREARGDLNEQRCVHVTRQVPPLPNVLDLLRSSLTRCLSCLTFG